MQTAAAIPEAPETLRADRLAAAPPSIAVEGLSKTFKLPHQQAHTLKERVLHPRRSRTYDELRALRDVSVEIREGEFFGIVGRNGSGKSTLLKCLAGIYQVEVGRASVVGRLSPFIELGVGFNGDLTARDNVLVNAVMLGLSRKQARERFDEIVEFAELHEFLDLKLKNYSSGMTVRLAFAISTLVDAEVVLVDEVLAVGDARFAQKCYDRFNQLKAQGTTIVFVTHDMGAVERFCDRAMLLERGEVLEVGEPRRIARRYNELNFGELLHATHDGERHGAQVVAEVKDAWFEDGSGDAVTAVPQGGSLVACMDVAFHQDALDPVFAFTLRNDVGHTVFAVQSDWQSGASGSFAAGSTAKVRLRVQNLLVAGRYALTPSVARPGQGDAAYDVREDLAEVVVHAVRQTGGLVDPPHSWEVERP